ncbi:acetoacetyl-CoA synthetase, partial [Trichonephila inaurata madagascariensis]
DDVLTQAGECFGSADIYFAIHDMEEINDYICVGQTNSEGDVRAVLFVKLRDGLTFTPALRDKIAETIDEALWRDLVPEVILDVKDIPYNLNGKRMESTVKKIVATNQIPEASASNFTKKELNSVQHRASKIIIGAVSSAKNKKAKQEWSIPPIENMRDLATIKFAYKLRCHSTYHISKRVFIDCKRSTRLKRSWTLQHDRYQKTDQSGTEHSTLDFLQEPLCPKKTIRKYQD